MRLQKNIQYKLLFLVLCSMIFTGCARAESIRQTGEETTDEISGTPAETAPEVAPRENSISKNEEGPEGFGAVPWFDKDTNSMLQYEDGYLYGYIGGRIFRIDAQTGEETTLVMLSNFRSNYFCIDRGYLYFINIPWTSQIGGTGGDLYRLDCNGTGEDALILLAENIRVSDQPTYAYSGFEVNMDVYDDILYIIHDEEVSCLQLLTDGNVEEIAPEDTLYGLLPEGYSLHGGLPSIPYCAAHYGYFFAKDEEGILGRIDAESGKWEGIAGSDEYTSAFLTHEGIYLRNDYKSNWVRYDLNDMTVSADCHWGQNASIIDYEEDGVYLRQYQNGTIQLLFVNWEGNETELCSFQKQGEYDTWPHYGTGNYYIRDGWLYYRDEWDDGCWLMRIALTGGEPEKLYLYYRTSEETTRTETIKRDREDGERRISTSITKLWLQENEEGAAVINSALREVYTAAEADMEDFSRSMVEMFSTDEQADEEWIDIRLSYCLIAYEARVKYVDEDYFCIDMYCYKDGGGAHGMYWSDYYVYDRHTGRRLSWEDFVNNSQEEFTEIVESYLHAYFGDDPHVSPDEVDEAVREALEQDRFFLTAEGLGIYYDLYEFSRGFSEGAFELVIPFREFDMKEGRYPDVVLK